MFEIRNSHFLSQWTDSI